VHTSDRHRTTLVLRAKDIQQIALHVGLHRLMDEAIAVLWRAFSTFDPDETIVPIRSGFNYTQPVTGLVEWMPLFQPHTHRVINKMVGYHPGNPGDRDLPSVLSTVSAYDTMSGHLVAVMDATFLTALRTGAASAVASQILANPASHTLGLIGCGAQAVTQLHALSRVCRNVERVLVYDLDPAIAASFARRVECLQLAHLNIQSVPLETLVAEADILCTATSVEVGGGPVFVADDVKPWLHVNAIGADFPGKVEVPRSLLKSSFVCPDFRAQAVREGECQQLEPDDIGADICTLVQGGDRDLQHHLTVFDSTGFALEDMAVMQMMLDYATQLEIGQRVELEGGADDAMNPYGFVTATAADLATETLTMFSLLADRPRPCETQR
ncbi:MAG: hypothetical protein AAFY15_09475, partial [Cyanobacteria bacterium J06648_11]